MTLTNIIIKSYSSILITIGSAAVFFFMLGTYFILRLSRSTSIEEDIQAVAAPRESRTTTSSTPRKPRKVSEKTILSETLNDVSAISGEDPVATQLDLAKAYIESDKGPLAKIILSAVIRDGHSPYQEEAEKLLKSI